MPKLDERGVVELVDELLAPRPAYVPEWSPSANGLDAALVQIAARFWQAIIQRLNQAPEKNKFAFLDTLGIQLIPAQAARTPVVFRLADNVTDARLPANARIAAPPPPERNDQIIFETERATGLAVAKLKEVVSLWPGRDQYVDHSAAFLAGEAFQPFKKKLLQNTPHHLYIAHDTLLALAGKSAVDVIFDLTTASSEHLDILWEYWDGKVWRQFKNMQPQCDDEEARKLDSTDGLQFSGRYLLETDCAETSKTVVNGIEAFWVRGRLDEPLPPNPAQVLPEVESIKLSTSIAQPLNLSLTHSKKSLGTHRDPSSFDLFVALKDQSGTPLRDAGFTYIMPTHAQLVERTVGKAEFSLAPIRANDKVAVTIAGLRDEVTFTDDDIKQIQEIAFTLTAEGLNPEKAFADAVSIDLSKPFFPLGVQPQPGVAFYFTSQEVFSKPGARIQVFIEVTDSPQDQLLEPPPKIESPATGGEVIPLAVVSPPPPKRLSHTVSWEYWNGKDWIQVPGFINEVTQDVSAKDFTGTGIITELTIPFDFAPTKINNEDGLWMRVRLVSGGYGFRDTITDTTSRKEFAFIITQPPVISKFLLGYVWQYGPFYPEHVLPYNDFQYEDRTEEARLPGETFKPFKPVGDQTPTLYLGFDKKLPVDRLGILFDIA